MNQQFRYGENDIFFSKRSKRWRGFPPGGLFVCSCGNTFVEKLFCLKLLYTNMLRHVSSLSSSSILLVRFLSQLFFKCKEHMAYLTSLWKDNLMLVSCFSLVPRYHLVWAFEEHCVLFHVFNCGFCSQNSSEPCRLELEYHDLLSLFEFMDNGDGQITLTEFIEGSTRLRGSAKALDVWRLETKAWPVAHGFV